MDRVQQKTGLPWAALPMLRAERKSAVSTISFVTANYAAGTPRAAGAARVVWSRAVPELARAIAEGRPHRASGEHAAHLVEIMDAVGLSISSGRPVEVTSSFVPPAPMEWA